MIQESRRLSQQVQQTKAKLDAERNSLSVLRRELNAAGKSTQELTARKAALAKKAQAYAKSCRD